MHLQGTAIFALSDLAHRSDGAVRRERGCLAWREVLERIRQLSSSEPISTEAGKGVFAGRFTTRSLMPKRCTSLDI
jgi:hypothetical protein